jgi:hypothetical protein
MRDADPGREADAIAARSGTNTARLTADLL